MRGALAVAFVLLTAAQARADVQACFDAALRGQELRRSGKLLEARDAFVACGKSECPPPVVQQCTSWLKDVDEATPSILATTRDADGHDLADATIAVDGVARRELALGRALALDPGPHTIVWRRAGGASVQQSIVISEREKARVVSAVFAAPEAPRSGPPPLVYVLAGTAVAGAALFAFFGAKGYADRQSLGCDAGCATSDLDRVRREFVIADVALGTAILSAAGALWVYFASRREAPAHVAEADHSRGW